LRSRPGGGFATGMAAAAMLAVAASASFDLAVAAPPPPKKPPPPARVQAPPRPPARTPARPFNAQVHPVQPPRAIPSRPIPQNNAQARPVQQLHVNRPPPPPNALPNRPNGTAQGLRPLAPNGLAPNGRPGLGPLPTGNALRPGPGRPLATPLNAGLRPGPGALQPLTPAFPAISVNNRFYPIVRGQKSIYLGGVRRSFVPLGILGVALIGGSYWYPDGYVAIDRPYCAGLTPDGCSLQWRMVDLVDGGAEPQCVQYCPQAGPPPVAAAELPPPPPPPPQDGQCQVTIFSDPNLAGTSAPTGDNQPKLSQTGWRNEISSVQVQSGTWDFFTDEDFGGVSMRLAPGNYPMLAPDFDKKIGSFMCAQAGPGV
jgi:hypothetical protein